jgi:hypothetical protein
LSGTKIHLVIPDSHAKPGEGNKRALWVAELIKEVKPDVVIHLGDSADMPSLSSYDRGTKGFHGRRYKDDIDAHLDFQDKLWSPVKKAKKRLPLRIFMHGNHEERINRAVQSSSELDGTIGYEDLNLSEWYDEEYEYNGTTPAVAVVDGIAGSTVLTRCYLRITNRVLSGILMYWITVFVILLKVNPSKVL